MNLSRLQQVFNWILPIALSISLYTIVYIAGHFEPEIFSIQVIVVNALIIGCSFFLTRIFLRFTIHRQKYKIFKPTTFIIALGIATSSYIILFVVYKQFLILTTPQYGSIRHTHLVIYFSEALVSAFAMVGFQFFIHYFEAWNESIVKSEKLEKENTKARLASLQLQLNPHFLFNNFNTLEGLIHEDKTEASAFLNGLASLYRLILQYSDEKIILLQDEVSLVSHFNYLMKKRFGNNYKCQINLSERSLQEYHVPPMSIQLLLENVVKHNQITDDHPLTCTIQQEGNYIQVRNKLSPKTQTQQSSKIGLENLKARIKLLSDEPLVIEKDNTYFSVSIPLLKPQSI